jgi:hypothetical protein
VTVFEGRLAQNDNTRVLCGAPDCRDQVARVLRFIGGGGVLCAGPGWELTERGDYRLLHRTRGAWIARRISGGRALTTAGMDNGDLEPWMRSELRKLPVYVRCAASHVSRLQADTLQITLFDNAVEAL